MRDQISGGQDQGEEWRKGGRSGGAQSVVHTVSQWMAPTLLPLPSLMDYNIGKFSKQTSQEFVFSKHSPKPKKLYSYHLKSGLAFSKDGPVGPYLLRYWNTYIPGGKSPLPVALAVSPEPQPLPGPQKALEVPRPIQVDIISKSYWVKSAWRNRYCETVLRLSRGLAKQQKAGFIQSVQSPQGRYLTLSREAEQKCPILCSGLKSARSWGYSSCPEYL